jgi:hypothetical protein
MFKESLITIILLVVIYQLYIVYYPDRVQNTRRKTIKRTPQSSEVESPKVIKKLPERKPMQYETPQSFEHPTLGKPDKIIEEGYLYLIQNPNPWNAIVYNANTQSYLFIIKLNDDPTTIQNYSQKIINWSKVIKNISLNTQSNELIIPSDDEDVALAIANLVLNNLKGDLNLQNIIDNNLIQISITKIKNYSSVKQKIKEQILESINNQKPEAEESLEYQEDLAQTVSPTMSSPRETRSKDINPSAYEGIEFSYL